jgi:hypothetical protein
VDTNDASAAVVTAHSVDVTLASTTLSGRLDVEGHALESTTITGVVGRHVHLQLRALADHDFRIVRGQPGPVFNDQLAVTGDVNYDGSLFIGSIAPFQGGVGGQVIPIMTAGATGNGSFGKIYGLAQGLVHSWRTYHPGNSIQLVGYNPHTDVFVNEFVLAVAEGGGAATYQICLGPTAPAADVAVAVTRRFTHIEVAPPVLTYTTSNWPLPQTVTVAATNGVVIEPPQTDTVAHTVTSADAVYDGAVAGSLPVNVTDNDGSTDLALVVTAAPDTVLLGQTFDVSYRLTNNGSTLSTGATFTTSLTGLAYMTVIGATC